MARVTPKKEAVGISDLVVRREDDHKNESLVGERDLNARHCHKCEGTFIKSLCLDCGQTFCDECAGELAEKQKLSRCGSYDVWHTRLYLPSCCRQPYVKEWARARMMRAFLVRDVQAHLGQVECGVCVSHAQLALTAFHIEAGAREQLPLDVVFRILSYLFVWEEQSGFLNATDGLPC